jgi:outer membrane protein
MKRSALLLALSLASPLAFAENLLDVYRLAQTNDPTWARALAAHQANIEKGPQGRALLLPSVLFNASAAKLNQESKTATVDDSFRYRNDTYSVQLTQPLYRKQNFAAYAQGVSGVSQAEAELAIARQDLILRVAGAYFDVLAAHDTLDYTTAEKQAIDRQLGLATRNYDVGTKTLVDVHEAQARFDQAHAQEIVAGIDLNSKQEALIQITRAPAALAKLAARLPLATPEPNDPEKWTAAAQAQSAQIKVKEEALEIALQEIEKNRGGHYPTLDLVASRSYSDAGGSVFGTPIESTTDQIALQLQVPLFQGGSVASKVRESLARRDEAREGLEQTRREVTRQAREAYVAVVSGISRVKALEQALASNQRALESTVQGFETGVRTGIDVLNAQRDLYRAKRDLSQARYNYLVSRLRLKAAAGTLGEDDVLALNALLENKVASNK